MSKDIHRTDPDDIAYGQEPLSSSELKWVSRFQRVLAACPERLCLINAGDPGFYISDREIIYRTDSDDIADGGAERNGLVLATVRGGPLVHGVS